MRHLLQLDLEATPELCRAGLAWVEDEFESAYRPTPNVRTWRSPSRPAYACFTLKSCPSASGKCETRSN